jgi:hypothetical protein
MGPRVTFDENKKLRDREYLLLSLLPVPAVRTNTTCKTKKNQQTINLSFFLFLSISLSSPHQSFLLHRFKATIACCCLDGWRWEEKKLS